MRIFAAVIVATAFAQDKDKPAEKEKIELPTSAADLERGKKLFLGSCTYCHGPTGDGGKGADLARAELVRAKTDGDLVRIIEVGIPGTEMPGAWHMVRREVLQTAAFVRTLGKVEAKAVPGDPQNGKALYAKHGCATCHTIKESNTYAGGLMGPDLSSIGLRRNATHLRESLVKPSASVPDYFLHTKVTLKSGKTIEGRRTQEDTFSIVVRDFNGSNHSLKKTDVKDIKKDRTGSPMPAFDKLSASDLDNLVAYLVSLKEPL